MRTLLLADDNVTVQRVIGLTFADEAFRVVTVSDGQAAIDRLKSEPPDIVLAGTTMPNVNGYEVAAFVRSQPSLKAVPVLLLTGALEFVDPARLEASGASGVFEKPLEPMLLINRVKELLGIKSDARPTPVPGRVAASAETPSDKTRPLQRGAPASSHAGQLDLPPVRAAKVPSWHEITAGSSLALDARLVEDVTGPENDVSLDTLDAGFDSLDQHLAGRVADRVDRAPAPPFEIRPPSSGVADDFAALLAFEQGEHPHPPQASPVVVHVAAPEITDAMLDQIAERVVDRLNAGSFADHLRDAMTATVRDAVHAVVSETSERLVRDEIARVKAHAERPAVKSDD